MNVKIKIFLYLLASACVIVPLYILCHEGGHALVALLCGARITNFSIIGAFVSSEGGNYNVVTRGLLHSAGMLMPVLISIIYMSFYKREKASAFYRLCSFLFVMGFSMPVAVWILVPVLYLMGKAPVGDDVTQFLDATGMQPALLMAAAAVLLAGSILLAWHRGIISNYWKEINPGKKEQSLK